VKLPALTRAALALRNGGTHRAVSHAARRWLPALLKGDWGRRGRGRREWCVSCWRERRAAGVLRTGGRSGAGQGRVKSDDDFSWLSVLSHPQAEKPKARTGCGEKCKSAAAPVAGLSFARRTSPRTLSPARPSPIISRQPGGKPEASRDDRRQGGAAATIQLVRCLLSGFGLLGCILRALTSASSHARARARELAALLSCF
jgi:hypothetical protein